MSDVSGEDGFQQFCYFRSPPRRSNKIRFRAVDLMGGTRTDQSSENRSASKMRILVIEP